jgi:hypothetical protein
MSSHLTEAGEITRRLDLAAHASDRAHRATRETGHAGQPRRRHQLADRLRRFADRLDQ